MKQLQWSDNGGQLWFGNPLGSLNTITHLRVVDDATQQVLGIIPLQTPDDGAGCTDTDPWDGFLPAPPRQNVGALTWTLTFDPPHDLPPDRQAMRRLLSERLQALGDEVMAEWEERYGG